VLYISLDYCTAIHKCACGCGNEVVTPISPTDWEFTFNGKTVSLHPSIGNWNFDCKSHYWIKKNKIKWAGKWDEEEIEQGRKRDNRNKQLYYDNQAVQETPVSKPNNAKPKSRWKAFANLLGF